MPKKLEVEFEALKILYVYFYIGSKWNYQGGDIRYPEPLFYPNPGSVPGLESNPGSAPSLRA